MFRKMFKKKNVFVTITLFFFAALFLRPTVSRHFNQKQTFVPVRFLVVRNLQDNQTWAVDNLEVGDEEYLPSGGVVARLTAVKQYGEGFSNVAILDVDVLASYDPQIKGYLFKQEVLLVGSTVELRLGQVLVFGQVIALVGDEEPETEIIVTAYLYSQRDWLANTIAVGDVMTSGKNREVVAKILSKQIYPANTEYRVDEGFVLGHSSVRYRDLKLTFSLKVKKRNGGYVFASLRPVKVNSWIDLSFDKYNLYNLEVIGFAEVTSEGK